jgi:hypothetical protein
MGQNDIRRERDQLGCMSTNVVSASFGPTSVDPHVLTDAPARLLQPLHERPDTDLIFFIIRRRWDDYANAPHLVTLLRMRIERPRSGCATEKSDELAAVSLPHPRLRTGIVPTQTSVQKGVERKTNVPE